MSVQKFPEMRVGRNFIRKGDTCDARVSPRKCFHPGFTFVALVVNGDNSWVEVQDPYVGFTRSVAVENVRRVAQTKAGLPVERGRAR